MLKRFYIRFINWLWYHNDSKGARVIELKHWDMFLVENKFKGRSVDMIDLGHWPNWRFIFKRITSLGAWNGDEPNN